MPGLNIPRTRELLQKFNFGSLFINELGWSQPASLVATVWDCRGARGNQRQIAQLSGVVVLEITAEDGKIPDAKTRAEIQKEISRNYHENLLIFLDAQRTQSLWYWVKRENNRTYPREHSYFIEQPGDLFLSKLSSMVVDLSDFDAAGNLPVTEVASRLKQALDVEQVTKKFYSEFQAQHIAFLELILGIDDEKQRRWYASVLLNRLMLIYFLQRKGFLDNGNMDYLRAKLEASQQRGPDQYYSVFLKSLFFEGFAKPEDQRSETAKSMLGQIRYLNGGLFLPHEVEIKNPNIDVPDAAFDNLFGLFARYSWNLDDTPGGADNELNPDVLGYIFEKYINQKAFGAYYTRTEMTEYLCEQTIFKLILERVNSLARPLRSQPRQDSMFASDQAALFTDRRFDSIPELLMNLDGPLCRFLLTDVLPSLSLLDPACGSGAFLVAAMRTLVNIYAAIIGKIKFLNDRFLTDWLQKAERDHRSIQYFIKKRIITDNLFGVDIMPEATEIARLRLFLALIASAHDVEQLEPLPNIDFNILAGNSLIGLLHIKDEDFERRQDQLNLFRPPYRQVLEKKNRLIDNYRHAATYAEDLRSLRDDIQTEKTEALATLNDILLDEFKQLDVKVEEATWDDKNNKAGKPKKRALRFSDIEALHPFHWGYEFDEVLGQRGGFDAIITNPPWEIFKPQAKEFFAEHSEIVTKNKMTIKEFEKEQTKLLKKKDVRQAWLEYQNRFPHVSQYYRGAPQYKNQIAIINGKKAGTDINLFKLFTEQCFNLLRSGGQCGIVIPSGIYTDLGATQLREMLFNQTEITGLFCFENRKEIFEGVHRSYKFIVLTFGKGGATTSFPAAFMRHDVAELERFPREGALQIPVELIRSLSPDSMSIMEFKNETDIRIAKKMLRFPPLGVRVEGTWNLVLNNEFHMTNDSKLFKTSPQINRLPLFTGKMFHQFFLTGEHSGYWIDEDKGRAALLGKAEDKGQKLDYQSYRLVHRRIARNTDSRTMISSITPKNVFTEVNSTTIKVAETGITNSQMLFLCAVMNSFTLDWRLRQSVTTTLNMFFIYQLAVPRLMEADPAFKPIVERAAKLVCASAEFDELARDVGLSSHKEGANDEAELSTPHV